MLEKLFDEIVSSKAEIIEFDEVTRLSDNCTFVNVIFNDISGIIEYREKLNNLLKQIEHAIGLHIFEMSRDEKIKFLSKLKIENRQLIDLFHRNQDNTIELHYLTKKFRKQYDPDSVRYDGSKANYEISEFLGIQLATLESLEVTIDDLIQSAKVSHKVPKKGMDLPVLMVIIYYLNQEGVFVLNKISQDETKKARMLSILLNKNFDNILDHLKAIRLPSDKADYFNIETLSKVEQIFKQAGMESIVKEIQSEIKKLN